MKIRTLDDIQTAIEIGAFLTGPDAFEQTWAPKEKEIVAQAPIESIGKKSHRYWYIKSENNEVIGAIGVRENKLGSGGYEMDDDYIAIHKDHRNKGIASQLLSEMEKFVEENHGRYIHVVTCDIPSYAAARAFYEKHGYKKVGHIPDYFVVNEGRIDYLKEL
jgi:ribosomal protein S18 acetylase RimI-like enzyme